MGGGINAGRADFCSKPNGAGGDGAALDNTGRVGSTFGIFIFEVLGIFLFEKL